jgi:23S rRNA (cytosine1962-C5)-methyltransferase
MHDVVLQPGRDRSLRRRHPWLLSGALARVEGLPEPGAWVCVRSAEGEVLGFGHWSPSSQIRVRMLQFGKEPPDDGILAERIERAVARRAEPGLIGETDALRLVNAEADGLPGLVVDRYADVVVAKLLTAGMAARRDLLAQALQRATGAARGFERADTTAARREGMPARQGALWGEAPAEPVWIQERSRRYAVDVVGGQKSGFYLDQRDSRDLVEGISRGRRVLDLFAYTGGFAVAAARGGAREVVLVESSAEALALAERNLAANAPGVAARRLETDAFQFLRRDEEPFDLLVVDPPPLAKRRGDVPRASRAYKDVMLHALRRAAPGALLLVFSCSHHVDAALFRKLVFAAAHDAARPLQVLRTLGAPADHPVSIDHPEGEYLKGLLLRA